MQPEAQAVNRLVHSGYKPLAAMVLASRNICDREAAQRYLACDTPLIDPFCMTDMALAAGRVALAIENDETIAVFGDYDVDGITATCLLTDYLRACGARCIPYIPGRLEEGYGLNPTAIHHLHAEGVSLIITVDCGITAVEEAQLCKALGIDLVITDHHECKETLPEAVAVVDPHRPDCGYPHMNLSGVGVAFKLAAALSGDQEEVLESYADMVCLGTVADVMMLQGENRVFVNRGLQSIRHTQRPGIAALMEACNCDTASLSATAIGFMLAPRINAAGRMGQIDLAIELFLTDDPQRAASLAEELCALNRKRQDVEAEIYNEAMAMLSDDPAPSAIVLASDKWHQGVVGIVASRIAEEYCCPTFLICLDGDHGKASSRSYGSFNLFGALRSLSSLLESYGGHELAAGFTIARENIDTFRDRISQLAAQYYTDGPPRTTLDIDCAILPEYFTVAGVDSLSALEPCGNGCPKPVLMMEHVTIERVRPVGNGRHLRLRLQRGNFCFNAIYFSVSPQSASISQGDVVDVAFLPQINEFRGDRMVQMNIQDIRPACKADCSMDLCGYGALHTDALTAEMAGKLLPDRPTLALVWRYLASAGPVISEEPMCLCRKIVRRSEMPLSLGRMRTCLDIFSDVGLIRVQQTRKYLTINVTPGAEKADLQQSITMQTLLRVKES